jgi:DnaA-homolog protein
MGVVMVAFLAFGFISGILPKIAILVTSIPMQLPLRLIDPPAPRLAEGVVGRNAQALDALGAFAINARSHGFATFCLWGGPGSGKSFWLGAWKAELPNAACLVDCAEPSRAAQALELAPAQTRLWLLDNLDRASAHTAEALFRLYNSARENGQRIIAATRAAPLHLALREDLRTRVGQGLVFELHELSDEEKKQALRERAVKVALPLSEEALNYLMTHLPRDLGLLTRVLDALNELSLSKQRPATLPLLKELLDTADATTRPV